MGPRTGGERGLILTDLDHPVPFSQYLVFKLCLQDRGDSVKCIIYSDIRKDNEMNLVTFTLIFHTPIYI